MVRVLIFLSLLDIFRINISALISNYSSVSLITFKNVTFFIISHIIVCVKEGLYCMQVKKQGMQADISELCAQLDALGLKIIQVTADGNCFFRFVEILFGLDRYL